MSTSLSATEGLGTSQLRRFFLPGLIAAVGLYVHFPSVLLQNATEEHGVTLPVLFVIEVLFFGFLITSGLVPIFQVYEGFLLPWLTKPARSWNERRVSKLQEQLIDLYSDRSPEHVTDHDADIVRIERFLSDFPIRQEGDSYVYEVERPTRLGNIVATYELYAERRYEIDGIFYWYHLAYLAPEASRNDLQENTVFAESILLASASGALVAMASGLVLIGYALGALFPPLALLEAPASKTESLVSMVFGLLAFLIFYRLSWPAHRALGKSFCALVDLAVPAFQDWASKAPIPAPAALKLRGAEIQKYLETLHSEPTIKSPNPGPEADT